MFGSTSRLPILALAYTAAILPVWSISPATALAVQDETVIDAPAQAQAIIEAYAQSGQFQGAIRISDDGAVILDTAYGVANVETGQPNTTETRFYVASITKLFTALAVLQLAERELLDPDAVIGPYFPDLSAEIGAQVTIRQLLSHTSGLVRDHTEFLQAGESPSDPDAVMLALNRSTLLFAPGSAQAYSNTGYHLLAAIVEQASGEDYAAYLARHVFAPAGMSHTGVSTGADGPVAAGHTTRNTLDLERFNTEAPTGTLVGAGGVYTTTGDLSRFTTAFRDHTLLGAEWTAVMTTPAIDGETDAMGLEVLHIDEGINAFVASGAGEGQVSVFAWLDIADDEIIFLANSDLLGRRGVPALFGSMLMTVLGMEAPPEAPATPLRTFIRLLDSAGEKAALAYAETLDWDEAPIARAGAIQATGAPNSGPGESALAWAPATGDAGQEWLTARFSEPVMATRIEIVFSQIPEALTGVQFNSGPVYPVQELVLSRDVGPDGAPRQVVTLAAAQEIGSVTVHLDTAATPGWPQIDTIGLITAAGESVWADEAVASTSAFLNSPPVIHDYPGQAHLGKLARFLDQTGREELADRVRTVAPRLPR